MMRDDFLREHKAGLWNRLILHGELTQHLNELDKTAQERIDLIVPKLTEHGFLNE